MTLQEILSVKGTAVFSISPEATLAEVVRQLAAHNVGALLVCRGDDVGGQQLVGIITERDLVHCFAAGKCNLGEIIVCDVMTVQLITASPSDTVENIMGVMTDRRVRHVPVLAEGRLAGMVSIGDLLKAQHDRLAVENRFMRDYIQQV
jgi:CBS domain-containing protein